MCPGFLSCDDIMGKNEQCALRPHRAASTTQKVLSAISVDRATLETPAEVAMTTASPAPAHTLRHPAGMRPPHMHTRTRMHTYTHTHTHIHSQAHIIHKYAHKHTTSSTYSFVYLPVFLCVNFEELFFWCSPSVNLPQKQSLHSFFPSTLDLCRYPLTLCCLHSSVGGSVLQIL